MRLFTKDIDKKLFAQYRLGANLENQMVVAKIFNPYGRGCWYLLNSDPEDSDYLWAIVDLFEVETGSVSRSELESIKVPPFGLGLERDLYFTPINAKVLYDGLLSGKHYAKGGETDNGNLEMLRSNNKAIRHHTEELENELKGKPSIEAWVVAKGERAATDLSDITHYLDGREKMAHGGEIDNYQKFDFNSEGNLASEIDGKKYEIIYRDDKTKMYDLFEDGKKINSSKSVRDVMKFADGGELDWGADLGDGFHVGMDVYITDSKSMFKGKTGFVSGLAGKDLLVTISENGNDRNVVVSKKGIEKLDAPEFGMGGEVDSSSFDELKKGDKIEITYGSGISKSNEVKLLVKSKNVVGKGKSWESEKITFQNIANPSGVNYFAYKRKDGHIGFAIGNMAISNVQIINKMAMGGETTFADKVKAVKSTLLKNKKVSPKVQKDYGKTYSPKEALESAKRIVGARMAKYKK